jgi:hypothetical protein
MLLKLLPLYPPLRQKRKERKQERARPRTSGRDLARIMQVGRVMSIVLSKEQWETQAEDDTVIQLFNYNFGVPLSSSSVVLLESALTPVLLNPNKYAPTFLICTSSLPSVMRYLLKCLQMCSNG